MPMTTYIVHTEEPKHERTRTVNFCIPVDDTHQIAASIRWIPAGGDMKTGRDKLGPASRKDVTYEDTQKYPDDKEAQEGQGPIAIHGLEHLVSSDKGVSMVRRMLKEGIGAVQRGADPKGVLRHPEEARCVLTTAGGVIRPGSLATAAS